MSHPSNSVSIHPYFKAHTGKLDAVKATFAGFISKTEKEEKNLYYDFTLNDHSLFCREAYVDADGLLDHLTSIDEMLQHLLTISDLIRVEVHGPAAELDKLRERLEPLNPVWFVYQNGVNR